MKFNVTIEADRDELGDVIRSLSSLEGTEEDSVQLDLQNEREDPRLSDLSEEERYVVAATQARDRRALRVIHRKATELEGSPFDDFDEENGWNDERKQVRQILWDLKGELVNNDGQRWYVLEDVPAIEVP